MDDPSSVKMSHNIQIKFQLIHELHRFKDKSNETEFRNLNFRRSEILVRTPV